MVNPTHPDFSFDTYPGLDADLTAAYERNVTLGKADPSEEIASSGLAAAVQQALPEVKSGGLDLAEQIKSWAQPELIRARERFMNLTPFILPNSTTTPVFDINKPVDVARNPNFATTINRLFEAKQSLDESVEVTPAGTLIGETMHLALVPWQYFKDNLDRLEDFVNEVRLAQGITNKDFINPTLLEAIKSGQRTLYRDVDTSQGSMHILSAREYLDKMIARDGPWGIMLVQTSNEAGIDSIKGQSPNQMTGSGTDRLDVDGNKVDEMGIFEWLALTFQENPKELSSGDFSWLLANRLTLDNGGAQVPFGCFVDGQVGSGLGGAGATGGVGRVRLAVM